MNLKDVKFSLKIVTEIVPIKQKKALDYLVKKQFSDLDVECVIAHNEYDVELEHGDNSTHVYYNIYINILCKDIKDTLEFIVEDMKSKDTYIKYIELEDKYISTEEVQGN